METIAASRKEAIDTGARLYQGGPCKMGHAGIRYVGNKACRECTRLNDLMRRRLASDAEIEAERKRKREVARAMNPAKRLERDRAYRARNAERIRQQKATYEQRDPNGTVARKRAKKEAERNRKALSRRAKAAARSIVNSLLREHRQWEMGRRYDGSKKARRRMRERDASGGMHTPEQAARLLESQGGRCAYCGASGRLQKDHKRALADPLQPGTNAIANIQWLCKPCNTFKAITPDHEYRATRGIPTITPWDAGGRAIWAGILLA